MSRGAMPTTARAVSGARSRGTRAAVAAAAAGLPRVARPVVAGRGRGRCRDEALAGDACPATVPAGSKRAAAAVADEDPPEKRSRPDGSALGLLLSAYDDDGGGVSSDHENGGDAAASGPSADGALEANEPDDPPCIEAGFDAAEGADGVPPQQGSRVCSYFLHRGNCVHGDKCAYSHDVAHVPLCRFYAAGRCRQGQRCHFAHRREPALSSARRRTESSPRPPAPSLLRRAWRRRSDRSTPCHQCVQVARRERVPADARGRASAASRVGRPFVT